MTVGENVAYGLKIRRVPQAERRERVEEALDACGSTATAARRPGAALRRAAPARRARARARQPAAGAAARRAARRARPEAPPGDADRAQAHPARGRDHVHLRHARPGRGADDERPHRGLQRGPDRAGRPARPRSTSTRARSSWPGSSASPTCSSGDGPPLSVRPEKIRILGEGDATRRRRARRGRGRSARSSTSGMATRYIVELDDGGELTVVVQNLETTSAQALEARGRRVRLAVAARAHSPTRTRGTKETG